MNYLLTQVPSENRQLNQMFQTPKKILNQENFLDIPANNKYSLNKVNTQETKSPLKNNQTSMSNVIVNSKNITKYSYSGYQNSNFDFSNSIPLRTSSMPKRGTRKMNSDSHNINAMLLINSVFGKGTSGLINNMDSSMANLTKNTIAKSNKTCLIRKPSFNHTNHKVTIQLFYYIPAYQMKDSNSVMDKSILTNVSTYLAQLYQKEVSLVMIRVHYPYIDSYILAQYLAHNASNNTFIRFQERIFTNASKAFFRSNLPRHITGIKVQISGRLITESVIPRITVKSSLIGALSFGRYDNNRVNSSKYRRGIDYSRFTHKNNLGSFTIKVWIASKIKTCLIPLTLIYIYIYTDMYYISN